MIITKSIEKLSDWIVINRTDQNSLKPYFIPTVNKDGNYELPNDALIEKGLREIGQDYTFISIVKGVSVEIDSVDFSI